MNSAKTNTPAKSRPWGRHFAAFLLVAIRHSSRWILRVFFTLLILLVVLFAYLHLVGVPAYFTDLFLDRMAAAGYYLQIERLTLEIDRGLIARHPRLFATADAPEPFLEAREMTVALDPAHWLRHGRAAPVLSIVDGALQAQVGSSAAGLREGSRSLAITGIHLRFSAGPREVVLREFSADLLGIHFRGRGAVYLPAPPATRTVPESPLAVVAGVLRDSPAWVCQLVEWSNEIEFNSPPGADFTFAIYTVHPDGNTFRLRLKNPTGGRLRGVPYDRMELDAAWKDGQVEIADLQIQQDSGRIGLSGRYDLQRDELSLQVLNTLKPATVIALLPAQVQARTAAIVADYGFPLRLELQFGPAPLASAWEALTGRVSFSGATVGGIPLDSVDARFSRRGPEWRIDSAQVQLHSEPVASRLDIREAAYHLASSQFQGRVTGTLNPHVLKPLLTPNMQAIVDWFGIRDPVTADLVIGGVAGNPAIHCQGPVTATNFTIHGAAVQSLKGRLTITNEVMHITEATLARPEGAARGDVHLAFSNQTLRLDVDSTLDLRATAEMLGPVPAEFMKPFRLNGPARVRIAGLLDICNFSLNRLDAQIEAQRFGYDRWEADQAHFNLAVRGLRFRFADIRATAYGGQFTGQGSLYPVFSDDHWRYEADMAARDARLADLLSASLAKPVEEVRGDVDLSLKIGGFVGRGTGPGVTGSGRVAIRDGLLFQTRLFSGLSAILAKILPEFSLFAQTDGSGEFTIRNSRISSRDIQLQGSIFSIKAAGDYAFAGNLDYRVEVQLLRGGAVATLVRLATLPVTRLLEFRLTGTFEDPRWRPLNLNPAEIFSRDEKATPPPPP